LNNESLLPRDLTVNNDIVVLYKWGMPRRLIDFVYFHISVHKQDPVQFLDSDTPGPVIHFDITYPTGTAGGGIPNDIRFENRAKRQKEIS
jgi:hypothetical protein